MKENSYIPALDEDIVGIWCDGERDDEVAAEQRADGKLDQDFVRHDSVPAQNVLEQLEGAPKLAAQKL